jgi:hypothetical protein
VSFVLGCIRPVISRMFFPPCHLTTVMQRADGRIAPWGLALWWPYHLALRSKLALQRRLTTEPAWNKIADGWCAWSQSCGETADTLAVCIFHDLHVPLACMI